MFQKLHNGRTSKRTVLGKAFLFFFNISKFNLSQRADNIICSLSTVVYINIFKREKQKAFSLLNSKGLI